MYTQVVNTEDIIGKTVKHIVYEYESIVISFTDQTFLMFEVDSEDFDAKIKIKGKLLYEIFAMNVESLIESGICTKEEYDEYWKLREIKKAKEEERLELQQYEKLKAKYEVKCGTPAQNGG